MSTTAPRVAVVMGSKSDWDTMRAAVETLEEFAITTEARVVSAHRTPELMAQFAREAADRGIQVIIAGAGGAAHLPGMIAAHTRLPVLGVPVESRVLRGVDSLLSIVQMPCGHSRRHTGHRNGRGEKRGAARNGNPRVAR
jgi:5-(carboxyamino)imidazole ribonucleotide mutase